MQGRGDVELEAQGGQGASIGAKTRHYSPCLGVLKGLYSSLPEAERRLADTLLSEPERVPISSITEVARRGGVAVSTVMRLCGKLGYSGFPEMKIALALELSNPERGVGIPEPVHRDDDAAAVSRKVLHGGAQNLTDTIALLDPGELERAARALSVARRVELYAQGPVTGAVGYVLQSRLLLAGIPSTVHTHVGYQHISAELMGGEDVAVGLSQSGETEPIVRALGGAAEMGATTVCVTNTPRSSLEREAQIRLLAATSQAGLASHRPGSLVAMVGVVEALFTLALVLKQPHQDAKREEEIGR